jgi:O-antigen/teichoic acid export membrane protein
VITLSLRFTLPLTAIVLVGADAIVDTLFGSAYDDAANVLRVIFLWVPLGWVSTMAGQALLAAGDYRSQVLVACAAVGVTVVLLGILVVPFGAVGAASAVACSELATVIAFTMVVRRRFRIRLSRQILGEWPYLAIPLVPILAVQAAIPELTLPLGVVLAGVGLLMLEHRRRGSTLALLRGVR